MSGKCPKCESDESVRSKYGFFVRISDKRKFQRFKCKNCGFIYSQASFHKCYRQKKRRLNPRIYELLVSGVSQRRIARLLKISRSTVVRKFIFLGHLAASNNLARFMKMPPIGHFQFDDMETIEHTKCKPLSVTLAAEVGTRKILGFQVSQMAAKGHLAIISRKKYGPRPDRRTHGRHLLFKRLKQNVSHEALIESDQNPHYTDDVKRFFPKAQYKTYLGEKSSIAGQGELKKVRFDPLFTVNHTFAMTRANMNRLFRRSWCGTKKPDRLRLHLELYTQYHNEVLTA